MSSPSISAVVTVYNAEEYIGESLAGILEQTRPPQEVIVVDDGSTDGTPAELAKFGAEIRVIRQPNRGHAPALNVGFSEARGDYIAKCDADDVWTAEKLERQAAAIVEHPEIDIAFTAVWVFGTLEQSRGLHTAGVSGEGVLERSRLAPALYRANFICPSSTLIRRELYRRLGPFSEDLAGEDYDYWFRALQADARFYYDPEMLVRYRRHDRQITSDVLRTRRGMYEVQAMHADMIEDRRLVNVVLADQMFRIGRVLVDEGRPREARQAFIASLRHGHGRPSSTTARALLWAAILGLPAGAREHAGHLSVAISRAADSVRGTERPILP
jgi:glycosyltransferase involved in cell wall biosynthesis